jgi:radical SAM superfamily enzyme YgiQ (UPF0313 family)
VDVAVHENAAGGIVPAPAAPAVPGKKRGLLLVPEFPYDSFWSFRYILRLIGRKANYPPLGLLTFAAYLPPEDWELEVVDLNVRTWSEAELRRKITAADVVFASAMSIQKRSLVEILEGPARGTRTPFVLGGPFASSYRSQILEPATPSDRVLHDGLDVLVWGEAGPAMPRLLAYLASEPEHDATTPELLIPGVVAAAEPGSRRYLNDRALFEPLDDVPLPRWDLIRVADYESMMIQTTAGCPFRCDFCDIIQFNGGFNRPKPPAAVRRELEALLATGFRGGVFSVDDNFVGSPDGIGAVLDAMIDFQREHDYPFTFLTQASVNLGMPELAHLIEKMKRAGFTAVFLGIENPDPDALRGMNKKQNLKVDIPGTIARLQEAGIEVYAGFILGSDEDTPATVDRIVDFVKATRIFTAMTGMLTPVPFTPLHERLRREGRLRAAEYSGNNTDDLVQIEPRRMTPAQLEDGIHQILSRLFEPAEVYRRGLDTLSAVRHHIFSAGTLQPRYLRAAAASLWVQGIRPRDSRYFTLLRSASRLDRDLRRAAGEQARRADRLGRPSGNGAASSPGTGLGAQDAAWLADLADLAREYLIRYRRDLGVEEVTGRIASIRERIEAGRATPEDLRTLGQNAAAHLRVRARQHRFPGIKLRKALEAAIRGLHYGRVTRAIVG